MTDYNDVGLLLILKGSIEASPAAGVEKGFHSSSASFMLLRLCGSASRLSQSEIDNSLFLVILVIEAQQSYFPSFATADNIRCRPP